MNDEIKEILEYLHRCELLGKNQVLTNEEIKLLLQHITNLQEKLEVSQTNEETYRLEMLDITKCLGLDENTIFDEVKEKATNLQEELEKTRLENKVLKEQMVAMVQPTYTYGIRGSNSE